MQISSLFLPIGLILALVYNSVFAIDSTFFNQLKPHKTIEHVMYETYFNSESGTTSVIGYHFDSFFTPQWFGTLAIFGAVGGNRGGYGIAGIGMGYRHTLNPKVTWSTLVILGSGGGGGIPAGGGLAVETLTGLSYEWMDGLFVDAKVGYLTFPSGTFHTPVFNIGVSYQMVRLYLPYF